jgi:HlyD family secretion protein
MTLWNKFVPAFHSASSAAVVALAITATITGCKSDTSEPADIPVAVQAMKPQVGPISVEITADAVLAPLAEAALSPRISSPIRAEYVQRGTRVHRGQTLLVLDDRDLQGTAMDTKGALTSAEASYDATVKVAIPADVQRANLDLATAKTNLDIALQTAADRKKLFAEGALPGRDADLAAAAAVQAQATYDTAKKRLEAVLATTQMTDAKAAQGQLLGARGRFMNAQAQVGFATLKSPIDGVVTDRPLFPGETAPAGTPVVTVMDTSSLIAKLHITQADAQQLSVGGRADVYVAGIQQPIEAKVSLISPALDPGSTTVEVWLKLPNADGRLKAGTAVHTEIRGTTMPNAVQIPVSSLLPTQGGGTSVMIVGADHVAHQRAVVVGIRTSGMAQIVKGISPNDDVITEGSYGLDDGTKVTLEAPKSDAEGTD